MNPLILVRNAIALVVALGILWFVIDSFRKLRNNPDNVVNVLLSILGVAAAVGFVVLIADDWSVARRLGKLIIELFESFTTTRWY